MGNATNRWLDRLAAAEKARGGADSDYRLSQLIGVERQQVSKWRREVDQMSARAAIRLAELLDVHPRIVIAEVMAERARDEREKRYWVAEAKSAAKKLAAVGAVILAASGIAVPSPASANRGGEMPSPTAREGAAAMYIMLSRRRAKTEKKKHLPHVPTFTPGRVVPLAAHAA